MGEAVGKKHPILFFLPSSELCQCLPLIGALCWKHQGSWVSASGGSLLGERMGEHMRMSHKQGMTFLSPLPTSNLPSAGV